VDNNRLAVLSEFIHRPGELLARQFPPHQAQARAGCVEITPSSPLDLSDGQTAEAHVKMIDTVLELYDKEIIVSMFLVADNCANNQVMVTRLGVLLIGCAQFSEVLSLLARIFVTVTGKPLRVRRAMGDADAA
jgi:hypothetical protein